MVDIEKKLCNTEAQYDLQNNIKMVMNLNWHNNIKLNKKSKKISKIVNFQRKRMH